MRVQTFVRDCRRYAAFLVLGTAAMPAFAGAQASTSPAVTPSPTRSCFRGRPKPTCDRFWLTEFGLAAPLLSGTNRVRISLEFGRMKNVSAKHAYGLGVFVEGSEYDGGLGLRPRYRYWLDHKLSVDVAPGIAYSSGLSGQIALNFADHSAVSLQVAQLRQQYGVGGNRPRVLVGARLGGKAGLFGMVATPLLGLLALALTPD